MRGLDIINCYCMSLVVAKHRIIDTAPLQICCIRNLNVILSYKFEVNLSENISVK